MTKHGDATHPRIGAVDHVSLHPLGGTPMEAARDVALRVRPGVLRTVTRDACAVGFMTAFNPHKTPNPDRAPRGRALRRARPPLRSVVRRCVKRLSPYETGTHSLTHALPTPIPHHSPAAATGSPWRRSAAARPTSRACRSTSSWPTPTSAPRRSTPARGSCAAAPSPTSRTSTSACAPPTGG